MARATAKSTDVAGVRFTSPGRLVYPETGISKFELAEHYVRVSRLMLPHLERRPVTMIRCPDNYHSCFFQKHIDKAAHYDGVTPVWLKEESGRGLYASVDNLKGLIALVQLGVVEFHTPGVRTDKLTQPDRFVLDLDPGPSVPWARIAETARALRDVLRETNLESFVKTTGGKGLHVVVPIRRTRSVDQVREFTRALAGMFEAAAPTQYTTTVSKARRSGKILIDYLRNAPGATAVEAYSARARAGATVAVPITWEELAEVRGDTFTLRNLNDRLAALRADPWEGFFELRQSITVKAMRQVGLKS